MTIDLRRAETQRKVINLLQALLKQPAAWERWLYGSLLALVLVGFATLAWGLVWAVPR